MKATALLLPWLLARRLQPGDWVHVEGTATPRALRDSTVLGALNVVGA